MTDNKIFALDFVSLSHDELELKYNKKYDTIRKFGAKLGLSRKHFIMGRPPLVLDHNALYDKYKFGMTITSLAHEYNTTQYIIKNCLKRNDFPLRGCNDKGWRRKYNFDENFFEEIDTEAKAYIFGFIMADGCLYSGKKNNHLLRINIKTEDIEVLRIIKAEMKSESPIKFLKNNSIDIKLFSPKMYDDLVKLGCTERKSLTLQFPQLDDKFLPHFIRGYFDGDGTVTSCNKNGKMTTCHIAFYSSHDFCQSLNEIMNRKFGFGLKTVTKVGNISRLSYASAGEIKKIHSMFYSSSTFWLTRKREKMEKILDILRTRRLSTL